MPKKPEPLYNIMISEPQRKLIQTALAEVATHSEGRISDTLHALEKAFKKKKLRPIKGASLYVPSTNQMANWHRKGPSNERN